MDLHSASNGYLEILEHLLEYDGCDVDPQNRIEKATPLHLAVRLDDGGYGDTEASATAL